MKESKQLRQMTSGDSQPHIDGKFFSIGSNLFLVKGVSYGTFAPDSKGAQFPSLEQVGRDFAQISDSGFNTIRTYTEPPPAVMDMAAEHKLRMIVGLAWPEHIPFLDSQQQTRTIRQNIVGATNRISGHPALLLIALGNEIPATIVRWHGAKRVETFLGELYHSAKEANPDTLFTYVNFPPTEYLDLNSFDVCAFNVYLHERTALSNYIARLQHVAGQKPLLLAETGSDSIRENLEGQAQITSMQIQTAFAEGACGSVTYAWTDEWWRGGQVVRDWAFGLVDVERRAKPALTTVTRVLAEAPFSEKEKDRWPTVSVVVCAHNASDTLDDCLTSLTALDYPNLELIVVNDGSTDGTSAIAGRYQSVRVIDLPGVGLSAARNAGLAAATGAIVAYTDADCRVDRNWLTYLVQPLVKSDVAGAGGPNVVPNDDPWVAQCVARAPGSPTHVMLDDRIAEHVPGCNMAFWREALLSIDGFNPVYLKAGDDVDICWRLQAKKHRIGFSASALVWHHRRNRVKTYWSQQVGYGEAETWLDAHHPEKFLGGKMLWHGRIYNPLSFQNSASRRRVNSGVWGTAAFPSVYTTQAHPRNYLPQTPAWMIVSMGLLLIGVFGPLAGMDAAWLPLIAGIFGVSITIIRSVICGWSSDLQGLPRIGRWSSRQSRGWYRLLIAFLHLIQPIARFRGRLRGLSQPPPVAAKHVSRYPWRTSLPSLSDILASVRLFAPRSSERSFWSESRIPYTKLLHELVGVLRASRPAQLVDIDEGWQPDRDLSLAVGRWGWLHVRTLLEEHDEGRCSFKVGARLRPSFVGTIRGLTLAAILAVGTSASIFLYEPSVGVVVSGIAIAATAARAAWQAIRTAVLLDRAVMRVATAAGMTPLPLPVSVPTTAHGSRETTLSEH